MKEKSVDGVFIKQATKSGYIFCEFGGIADLSYPQSKTRRGRVQNGGKLCPTLTAGGSQMLCVIEKEDEYKDEDCM